MHQPILASARRVAAGLLILLALVCARPAGAAIMPYYDMDSMVFMSTDIVEGTVVPPTVRDYPQLAVTAVSKGTLTPGQSVAVLNLGFYRLAGDRTGDTTSPFDVGQTKPLAAGERCLAFLAKDSEAEQRGEAIYRILPNGIRIVRADKMIGFGQRGSTFMPFTAQLPEENPGLTYQTPEQFRAELAASQARVEDWTSLLNRAPAREQIPDLLALLRERTSTGEDAIAERVCKKIARLADLDTIFLAMTIHPAGVLTLAQGLQTPEGRDAVLARVDDATAPLDHRLLYARALSYAGIVHRERAAEIGTPDTDDNARYLTRLARVAAQTAGQEELCLTLLVTLYSHLARVPEIVQWEQETTHIDDQGLLTDAHGALRELTAFHAGASTEAEKFRIKVAARRFSREAYAQLAGVNDIIAIVAAGGTRDQTPTRVWFDSIIYQLDTPVDAAEWIFEDVATGKSTRFPVEQPVANSTAGSLAVEPAKDLPHGRYRVYLQFTKDGKAVGNSHSLETEL